MKSIAWFVIVCCLAGCGDSSSYNPGYVISKSHIDELAPSPEEEVVIPLQE
jgi:hypothetical protein